jgi:hypothetical protein
LVRQARARSVVPAFLLTALMLAAFAAPVFASSSSPKADPAPTVYPRQVAVGLYINDIGTFDLTTGSFDADFYLWFRWQGNWTVGNDNSTVLALIANARASASGSEASLAASALPYNFEFMNSEGPTRSLIAAQPHFNGTNYNFLEYRIRGPFNVPVELNDYPLDEQTLAIEMEDSFYSNTTLIYVPDSGSVLDPSITVDGAIPGLTYVPDSFSTSVVNHNYNTAFGYQVVPGGNTTSGYSRFVAQFTLSRPFAASVTSLLLPVGIIIALAVVCFFIDAEKFEERLALLVTAVLTAVLLQVNFASTVPSDGQFTLADRVMLVVYAVLSLGITIAVLQKRIKRDQHPETILWLDRLALVIIPVATVVAIILLISPACAVRSCVFLG